MLNQEQQEIISKVQDFFKDKKEYVLVYLFGSAAHEGKFSPHSDVDIAVSKDGFFGVEERIDLALALEGLLNRKIDLLDFDKAEGVIWSEIISHSYIIKGDTDRITYNRIMALDYMTDFLPYYIKAKTESLKRKYSEK